MASDRVKSTDKDEGRLSNGALAITVSREDSRVVLTVAGEIDMTSVPTLKARLNHVLADSSESVVVDLVGVTFMDSSGLAALISARQHLAGTRRTLSVRNPTPMVEKLLTMTGLYELLCKP